MSLEGLEALRNRFRERSIEDLHAIETWVGEGCPPSEGMERTIHNLAGAAGTFGFIDLHRAAARIDDTFCAGQAVLKQDALGLIDALRALPGARKA